MVSLYKKMYLHLFNRVTDAQEALRRGDTEKAEEFLKKAQQETEAMYMEGGLCTVSLFGKKEK